MLNARRSLAFRASLIFSSVYGAIFLVVLTISALHTWADRSEGNQLGPVLARDYAIADLRDGPQGPRILTQGKFAKLAARNPSTWVVVHRDGQTFTRGAVTPTVMRTVIDMRSVTDAALFRIPGVAQPLGGAAIRRVEFPAGDLIVAAGGIDPATLSTAESMQLLLNPSVAAMLVVIALLGVIGMVFAGRVFASVLDPITLEAAAIGPNTPGRRFDPAVAPTELVPLVSGANAALDRLEVELGRRRRFITDVAHELRTPLAVIRLQADALPEVPGKADLQQGLARMTRLLSQMLDLERLTLTVKPEHDVDLVGIARDTLADLAPMALGRGYNLSLEAPDDPVSVEGDAHAVKRALVNLVGNAIVHGGNCGTIHVTVGAQPSIGVRDEGPGIPPDLEIRLFEPFSRGHASDEGSGLGLHLAREIMRAHGGDIYFGGNSPGATFELVFRAVGG